MWQVNTGLLVGMPDVIRLDWHWTSCYCFCFFVYSDLCVISNTTRCTWLWKRIQLFYTNTTVLVLPNINLLLPQVPIVAKRSRKKQWEETKQDNFLVLTKTVKCSSELVMEEKGDVNWNDWREGQVSFFHLFANHTTPGVWLCPGLLVRCRKRAAGEAAALLPDASWRQTEKEKL